MKHSLTTRLFRLVMLLLLALPVLAAAQKLEIPFHLTPHFWASGIYSGGEGTSDEAILVAGHQVLISGAPWLRLHFGHVNLGARSYLTVTSRQDGATQRLDAGTLAQWYKTSAYFNGDAVDVKLYVAPRDRDIVVELKEVMVGEQVVAPESQCGPTDDRVPSSHPASGRIVSVGCTGWIISNGNHLTAGHCIGSSAATLQFNVPPSLSNGTIQHPGPQDQYSVNQSNWQFSNGGTGNDWAVFQVFNNSQTGLQPIQAQGSSFTVVQNLTAPNIRITGFGVDSNDPTRNQTQQTHLGPNAGSSGTTLRYRTDTEGGNSGSPVIDEATGNALGIHTHGGCTTSGTGNNSGTSAFLSAFWNALNSQPCSNIAQGDPASASSSQGNNVPGRANDASTSTYWRSSSGGTQHWQVDLGSGTLNYDRVVIAWRSNRHAKNYTVRVSNSSTFSTFTTVYTKTNGTGGTETVALSGAPRTERYVRLHMTLVNSSYYGVNDFKVCGTSTAAANKESAGEIATAPIPAEITLQPNYPNPFNPSTNISFSLPQALHVSLKIYNTIGAEVATLVNEVRERGNYTVTFDASQLTSGVYFSVLQAGEVRQVRRLVYMK